jgi:hypothetical protein
VLVSSLAFNGCLAPTCSDDIVTEARSPDGAVVATVYVRNCGATTYWATHVSLRDALENFDPDKQESVAIVDGRDVVRVEWLNRERLLVTVACRDGEFGVRVLRKRPEWQNIVINYRQPCP